jgi:hypothetical protein
MQRRNFIIGIVGSAAIWPLAARAQISDRMRRIGVLMALAADDPEGQARLVAFVQGLQESGWTDGRNVRVDTRWAAGDADRFRRYAAELIALAPDVILASGGTGTGRGRLCRSHPQGRQAGRPSGAITDQVRVGDQSEDRQGARPHRAANTACARQRGDRIEMLFARVHEPPRLRSTSP